MHNKFYLIFFLFICNVAFSQQNEEKKFEVECIAFYNLENLFDTVVDPDTNKILQDDFTPKGNHKWNTDKYYKKIRNMAEVISKIGKEVTPLGPSVLGVCEIENRLVLEDLVAHELIASKHYNIIHQDGHDKRGIDCALIYDPLHFKVLAYKSIKLTMPDNPDFASRDQLLVSGELMGELIHFIVVHWPSRRGGESKSRPKRIQAAKLTKSIVDSLQVQNPKAKVVVMGDFNDDPISPSMKDFLNAHDNNKDFKDNEMFNTMMGHYKKGIGTLAYRDNWNLFDQFILTPSFIDDKKEFENFSFYKSAVYNKTFLKNQKGNFSGYPYRTYVGSTFMGGYSDHFPVYLYLIRHSK